MQRKLKLKLREACSHAGLEQEILIEFIERQWISPVSGTSLDWEFDEEDLARIQLIRELKEVFGVNNESVPIILHLLDQLYHLRSKISKIAS